MEHDLEETVIRPQRGPELASDFDDADTILVSASRALGDARSVVQPEPAPPTELSLPAAPVSPTTYRFVINTHAPIALDRPAHIGRLPRLPRVPQRVRPRLVRVPSPLQEVSGTHLEVRQEGASVIVTDLKSTNGTIVRVPGAAARALRPGESLVVTPGTVIDIGDGNLLEILPLQRSARELIVTEGASQ